MRTLEPETARRPRADAVRSHRRLLAAATGAFEELGADAPLEGIARRAGVGIGTLYRHFPTRLDLQTEVLRTRVHKMCALAADLETSLAEGRVGPGEAFTSWGEIMCLSFVAQRGLSGVLKEALGDRVHSVMDCWSEVQDHTDRLLTAGQRAGQIRSGISAREVMLLLHGIAVGTGHDPEITPRLLAVALDGLRTWDQRPGAKRGTDQPDTDEAGTDQRAGGRATEPDMGD